MSPMVTAPELGAELYNGLAKYAAVGLAVLAWPKTDTARAMSLMVTLPYLKPSAHSSACMLVVGVATVLNPGAKDPCMSGQHLMYERLRFMRTLAPAPSACPPGLPLAFCVHDACPAIVDTPTE